MSCETQTKVLDFSSPEKSDAINAAAEYAGRTLGPAAAASFAALVDSIERNAAQALSRAELLRTALDNINEMTASAVAALNSVDESRLGSALVARYHTLKSEVAKASSSLAAARQAGQIGAEVSATLKNLGPLASAADLLMTVGDPQTSASDAGKNHRSSTWPGARSGYRKGSAGRSRHSNLAVLRYMVCST